MEWIEISQEEPEYYKNVVLLLKDKSILYEWHKLSNGDETYFGSINTDGVIMLDEVNKWSNL